MLRAQFSYGKRWQHYIWQHWKWGEGEINFKGELCGIEYDILISTKNWLHQKCCQQVLSLSVWIAMATIAAVFSNGSSSIVITDISGNRWIELKRWFIHKGWKNVWDTTTNDDILRYFLRVSYIWRIVHRKIVKRALLCYKWYMFSNNKLGLNRLI